MQQANKHFIHGNNRPYYMKRKGQTWRMEPVMQIPTYQQFPQQPYIGNYKAGSNNHQGQRGEAIHPPEYKALYKLWNRMQAALTASEKREVFQLCEQAHDFKVENKISNALIVLQNTYVQTMQKVADKQMDVEETLEDETAVSKTITPPIQQVVQNQQVSETMSPQQNPLPEENNQINTQQEGGMADNNQRVEEEVVQQTSIQQQIDQFGVDQQRLAHELKQQITIINRPMQKQRSVIEQIALAGSRSGVGKVSGIGPGAGKSPKRPAIHVGKGKRNSENASAPKLRKEAKERKNNPNEVGNGSDEKTQSLVQNPK